jgi:hypothetical protein
MAGVFKTRVQAAYQAPSRAIARELAAGIVADYGRKQERGVPCFMDDFESCIAHLRFPVTHRRAIRTTKLARAAVRRGAASPQDHSRRLRRTRGFETDVRCADPRCRTMALGQSQRVRTPAAGGGQGRARSGIRGHGRPRCKALKGWKPRQKIQQLLDLTAVLSLNPSNLLLPINGLGACEQRQLFLKFGVRQGNRVGIGYGFVDN